jgi:hypothetical protein
MVGCIREDAGRREQPMTVGTTRRWHGLALISDIRHCLASTNKLLAIVLFGAAGRPADRAIPGERAFAYCSAAPSQSTKSTASIAGAMRRKRGPLLQQRRQRRQGRSEMTEQRKPEPQLPYISDEHFERIVKDLPLLPASKHADLRADLNCYVDWCRERAGRSSGLPTRPRKRSERDLDKTRRMEKLVNELRDEARRTPSCVIDEIEDHVGPLVHGDRVFNSPHYPNTLKLTDETLPVLLSHISDAVAAARHDCETAKPRRTGRHPHTDKREKINQLTKVFGKHVGKPMTTAEGDLSRFCSNVLEALGGDEKEAVNHLLSEAVGDWTRDSRPDWEIEREF